jgi:hypothetical protein
MVNGLTPIPFRSTHALVLVSLLAQQKATLFDHPSVCHQASAHLNDFSDTKDNMDLQYNGLLLRFSDNGLRSGRHKNLRLHQINNPLVPNVEDISSAIGSRSQILSD